MLMLLRSIASLFSSQQLRRYHALHFRELQDCVSSKFLTTLFSAKTDYHFELDFRHLSSKSKYPPLAESELEEKFIKGSGRGGQAVNKTNNCVQLTHKATGVVIKCHDGRSLEQNRKIARRKMQEALDKHFNGENSIMALERQKVIQQNKERKEAARRRMEEKRALKAAAAALKNEEDENNITDEGSRIEDDKGHK